MSSFAQLRAASFNGDTQSAGPTVPFDEIDVEGAVVHRGVQPEPGDAATDNEDPGAIHLACDGTAARRRRARTGENR
jgi:hypothetical protein